QTIGAWGCGMEKQDIFSTLLTCRRMRLERTPIYGSALMEADSHMRRGVSLVYGTQSRENDYAHGLLMRISTSRLTNWAGCWNSIFNAEIIVTAQLLRPARLQNPGS